MCLCFSAFLATTNVLLLIKAYFVDTPPKIMQSGRPRVIVVSVTKKNSFLFIHKWLCIGSKYFQKQFGALTKVEALIDDSTELVTKMVVVSFIDRTEEIQP